MKFIFLTTILALLISGCGSQINDYVKGAKRSAGGGGQNTVPTPTPPVAPIASSKAIKISPGSAHPSGVHVQAVTTISPSKVKIKGSQVDAKITLNQNRVN